MNSNDEMIEVKRKTAYPYWAASAVWIIAALFFPMYKVWHYILIAVLSAAAGIVTYKLKPYYISLEKAPEKRYMTGDKTADEIANSLLDSAQELKKLEAVATPVLAADVASIRITLAKIAESVQHDPADAKQCRRLINYYLPTVSKLADKYIFLKAQQSAEKNITDTLSGIEGAFRSIDDMLRKHLDALYENDALDIDTDITVLESMLKNDKLI
ncbi:MAG: 5-bromo-4-chloroindolyl phosphate hydrolysis family protein [Clostridia bacterium]|nr:5-bromo-4-chloroindolyl phosphate hydrolysis family protein [Clostridia bacterium]